MFTDVSDVIFQAHPFRGLPEGELLFFLEDHRKTIGSCPINSNWVQGVYGPEVLKQLGDKKISCGGTTFGSHDAMLNYLDALLRYARPELMARLASRMGHEQAIHNYLLYNGLLPNVTAVENGEFVYTLGHTPEEEIVITDQGIVVGPTRRLPAIIHQYNYRTTSQAYVARAYAYPDGKTA